MVGVSNNIMNYANGLQQFAIDDMPIEVTAGIARNTLSWHLSNLCRQGKLKRIGRGIYTAHISNSFQVKANTKARSLYKSLSKQFPLADFCVYGGGVITPLLHDLTPNNTVYIETNREVTESVFNVLLPKHKGRLFLSPTKKIASTYIDFSSENIIVKPLVTESPLMFDGKVPVPTIEKLLVDTRVDPDFYYLHGYENLEMLRTAVTHYNVNQTRLLRYADRRNEKESILNDLKEIQ
ncbi:MAG: hypothetical protein E7107_05570 [Prevotella sp.]|nr:hypothetical protein [Prevotella sp.]